jgi:ATP-dependent Lon protease
MSEKTINIVDHDKLVKVVNSFQSKSDELKGRVYEVLKNLWNSKRPHSPIMNEIPFETLYPAFPQFKEVIRYYELQAAVSRKLKRPFHASPVLLLGDPGLGKTYFASELAGLLELPYFEISLATATANFAISGGSMQWGEGRPGMIIDAIAKSQVANPIILIDELDKAKGDERFSAISPFYSLLEPHSAKKYRDEAIAIDVDASHVIWIATANEEIRIHSPILSRFKRFDIKQPTPDEMLGVIDSIYAMLRKQNECEELLSPDLESGIKVQLANMSPRQVRISLNEAITSALLSDRSSLIPDDIPNKEEGDNRVGFY